MKNFTAIIDFSTIKFCSGFEFEIIVPIKLSDECPNNLKTSIYRSPSSFIKLILNMLKGAYSHKNHLLFLFALLGYSLVFSQNLDNTKLEKSYKKYFELSRESVHLHLNKTTYLKGENIWFAAYILDRRSSLPSAKTTTLYCFLYNSTGKLLTQKILYVSNGVAFGQFRVRPEYDSSELYIKAYTNWMRNFEEENAFVQNVLIKGNNSVESTMKGLESEYEITLMPEGDSYISELTNNIGFRISSNNGEAVTYINGKVVDANGNTVVGNIVANSFGFGKFIIKPKKSENYSIRFELEDGTQIIKNLPEPKDKGINISVNNLFEDKVVITLRTNLGTFQELKDKVFHIAVHQDGHLMRKSFKLNSTEVNLRFSKKTLLPGTNIVTLFDYRLNPVAERLVFNNIEGEKKVVETKLISATGQNDSVRIQMQVLSNNLDQANLSISVLPETTIANSTNNSIASSLLLNAFTRGTLENSNYKFSNLNRKSLFGLDLLLLNEGPSNYKWQEIFQSPPQKRFNYDRGITIEGKVLNAQYAENNQLAIYPTQISDLAITEVNNNKDFTFNNVYLFKGDSINFTLLNKRGKPSMPKLTADFLPFTIIDKPFILKSQKKIKTYSRFNTSGSDTGLKIIADDNIRYLEGVTVYGNKKNLTENPGLTVGVFEGVKISAEDVKKHLTLSRFIRSLGYKVISASANGTFFVNAKLPMSGPPVIIFNGFRLREELRDFPLESVDEIYYEHHGTHGSHGGTIYIYQKNGSFVGQKNLGNFIKIVSTQGFNRPLEYYSPNYSSYVSQEFMKFGSVYWEANAITDEKGMFEISFPNYGLKSVKLFIEGMDKEGILISDVKIVQLTD